ncbi:MAG TPA: hypothetical protein PKU80_06355 [Candidatus Limiplasma sp.]|nr:hypothetical protein [Candidatus Limiplasma sp.]HRX08981.1 hypothetical protein [Candidatus Limiplasma sp.]
MQSEGLFGVLALIIILSAVLAVWRKTAALRQQLRDEWGSGGRPYPMDEDAMIALRECYREMPKPDAAYAWVDDITWADLDMDAIFRYFNRTQSGVGEEALFQMLHAIDASGDDLARRDRWMNAMRDDEGNRLALQRQLRKLGREHDHGAFAYLKDPLASKPKHGWVYYALALLPFVFAGLGFVNPYWLLGILGSFAVNAIVYYRNKKIWMRELAAVRHIAAVLRIGRRMGRVTVQGAEDGFRELSELSATLKVFGRWNAIFNMQRVAEYDFITDYLRIAFQPDMIALCRLSEFIKKHTEDILRVYQLIGELDACIAVASLRQTLAQFAVPEFHGAKRVEIRGAAHPLLKNPVRNDVDWAQNMLVTGSNASGKSTFVKALAINAILAQSVFTCWAQSVRMPRVQVITSMAIRDNVQGGESYFIVEIKSLKRILAALRGDVLTLCFIDEILRGTNTVERIAASKALLSYIGRGNALCIAATHDMELTKLLPGYRQVHFREEITPQGMVFPYRLLDGVSDTRNAIRLLEQMGFPAEVIHDADAMAKAE